jgi:hypothetical protein
LTGDGTRPVETRLFIRVNPGSGLLVQHGGLNRLRYERGFHAAAMYGGKGDT